MNQEQNNSIPSLSRHKRLMKYFLHDFEALVGILPAMKLLLHIEVYQLSFAYIDRYFNKSGVIGFSKDLCFNYAGI